MNKYTLSLLSLLVACSLIAQAPTVTTGARRTALPGRSTTVRPSARPSTTARGGNAPAAAGNAVGSTEIAKQLEEAETNEQGRPKLKFDNAPAELFLQIYAQVTKRTLLTSPDVPKVTMSLRSNDEDSWTDAEYLQAIETQLQLVGISVIPVGERFLIVVPFKTVGQSGIETFIELPPGGKHPEEGKVVRQIITPKNISAEEAQKAIESFKRPDGQIQFLERTNSLLITDTQENVNRMLDIINFIDKPLPVLEEVQVRAIQFAKAEDIKKALEEFVAESQKQEEQSKKSVSAPKASNSLSGGMQRGQSVTSRLPGVTRAQNIPAETGSSSVADALVSDADRGMIRGKVQIMADSRSNQLIIVTRPANMQFFDRIIKVLDVETAPEVAVEIIRLKYASADTKDGDKGVADLLNELIDASSSKKDDTENKTSVAGARDANLTNANNTPAPQPSPAARAAAQNLSASAKSKLGELKKENIKILPDPRINALMVMASPSDLAAIKEIIASMDIQVSQVLIETVVLNVTLEDSLKTGIDWVKRAGNSDRYRDIATGGGRAGTDSPINLFEVTTNAVAAYSGGAQYYATIEKLNLDVLFEAAASDGRSKILTSPVIMTQDNKEATIESTQLVYLYNGLKYMGGSYGGASDYTADIKQQEVGLTVKVTPRINPDGTVVLSVEETYQDINGKQTVSGEDWDKIFTRKITADISVDTGKTIVIGGLVKTTSSNTESGIPLLKDIPYVGKYLFGKTEVTDSRDELLVFMTPYVFDSAEEAQKEAARRKDYLNAAGVWNKGWSNSAIADDVDEEAKMRRDKEQRAYDDRQIEARAKRMKAERAHDEKVVRTLEKTIKAKQEELKNQKLSDVELKERRADLEKTIEMYEAVLDESKQLEKEEAGFFVDE